MPNWTAAYSHIMAASSAHASSRQSKLAAEASAAALQVGADCVDLEEDAHDICLQLAQRLGDPNAKRTQTFRSLKGAHVCAVVLRSRQPRSPAASARVAELGRHLQQDCSSARAPFLHPSICWRQSSAALP